MVIKPGQAMKAGPRLGSCTGAGVLGGGGLAGLSGASSPSLTSDDDDETWEAAPAAGATAWLGLNTPV